MDIVFFPLLPQKRVVDRASVVESRVDQDAGKDREGEEVCESESDGEVQR